jgi:F0F1-type ATP synthase membrane subunit a
MGILVAGATVSAAPGEGHGLPERAVEIAHPFGFPITNSMLVTWIVAAGLIVFVQFATRRMKPLHDGAQNFLEWHRQSGR